MDWPSSESHPWETGQARSLPARAGERRRSPRSNAQGNVQICFDDPVAVVVAGELVDENANGFRVRHESKRLVPGLEVRYKLAGHTGRARVVWTHILDGRRVSGLTCLPTDEKKPARA